MAKLINGELEMWNFIPPINENWSRWRRADGGGWQSTAAGVGGSSGRRQWVAVGDITSPKQGKTEEGKQSSLQQWARWRRQGSGDWSERWQVAGRRQQTAARAGREGRRRGGFTGSGSRQRGKGERKRMCLFLLDFICLICFYFWLAFLLFLLGFLFLLIRWLGTSYL